MNLGSTLFLKSVLIVFGLLVLTTCLFVLPYAIISDTSGMYKFILIGLYIPAAPFMYALLQAYSLLNLIDANKAFSTESIKILRKIKYSATIIGGLFFLGLPYIYYVADRDDAPGVILLGLVLFFASIIVATFAAVLQKLIQSGLEIKEENDLTV